MQSLTQFFQYMHDVDFPYVVLRNFENLPDSVQSGEHGDLDLLVYDLKHKIIPNGFVYAFILISFLNLFISPYLGMELPSKMELLAGPILAIPFVLLWFFSRGTWMGLGDGKLALGIGWMLGITKGISAILVAFWAGAIVGIILLFLKPKTITMKSEIPFGPFLVLGLLLVLLFNINILDFLLSF